MLASVSVLKKEEGQVWWLIFKGFYTLKPVLWGVWRQTGLSASECIMLCSKCTYAQREEFCRNVANNALLFCQLILMVCHSTIQQAGGHPRTLHLNFTAGGSLHLMKSTSIYCILCDFAFDYLSLSLSLSLFTGFHSWPWCGRCLFLSNLLCAIWNLKTWKMSL
jgi:hypothetical protein